MSLPINVNQYKSAQLGHYQTETVNEIALLKTQIKVLQNNIRIAKAMEDPKKVAFYQKKLARCQSKLRQQEKDLAVINKAIKTGNDKPVKTRIDTYAKANEYVRKNTIVGLFKDNPVKAPTYLKEFPDINVPRGTGQ